MQSSNSNNDNSTINNDNNDNNNNNSNIDNNDNKDYIDNLSPYVTSSSSLCFCDKCGQGDTEGDAHSRIQLTFILRSLTVIFEEVVGELSVSVLNNNNNTSQRQT